jgi:ATP-dependent Zn protease
MRHCSRRQRVAVHEAGHSVVARVLSQLCGHATILHHADMLGHTVVIDPHLAWMHWKARNHRRRLSTILVGYMMAAMAGREAESVLLGSEPDAGFSSDERVIFRLMVEIASLRRLRHGVDVARYRRATRMLVQRHAVAIHRVADVLLAKGTVSREELDAIVRKRAVAVRCQFLGVGRRVDG